MNNHTPDASFERINRGYNSVFQPTRLTVGLVVPLERYPHSPVPAMKGQVEKIQLAESLGFSAVWLRDVPFNVPSFGDAGQLYDPFVYLGVLAAQTSSIALGVASLILPIRHPAHVAKAAASVDVLSDGRMILGIASGDRPEEYPAMNLPYMARGARFRESFQYITAMRQDRPVLENEFGTINTEQFNAIDMLPKPVNGQFPMLITGGSQQSPQWAAQNADGWMTYPRSVPAQAKAIEAWDEQVEQAGRKPQPVMQPLYVDLLPDANAAAKPIHLGFQTGVNHLRDYLKQLEEIGVNHVALNLRFNESDIQSTIKRLAEDLLPHFA